MKRERRLRLFLAALLLVAAPALAQVDGDTTPDGPYVTFLPGGGWAARWADADPARAEATGQTEVRVAAPGAFPPFRVPLRAPAANAADIVPLNNRRALFVMADTHGEFEIAATLLVRQGVLDERLRWSFGRGHLVVTGDMLDRGTAQIELLWLLYDLERQARREGGGVHVLLGNHEGMVLRGDLRYLHSRYPQSAAALGVSSYSELFGPSYVLGQWLRTRASVLRLGDMLFVHGGISHDVVRSGMTIEQINTASREALNVPITEREQLSETQTLVTGPDGPLWYRGYFPSQAGPAAATDADVRASLEHFGVRRIFVGHAPVDTVTPLYGGRVVAVQVYPRRDRQTGAFIMEGALRQNGIWYRARADGTRERLEE